MDNSSRDDQACARSGQTPPPSSTEADGGWRAPVTPLHAARLALGRSRAEVAADIRRVCSGHNGQPCTLNAVKLEHYETRQRHPGPAHVTVLSCYYGKPPEELGLST